MGDDGLPMSLAIIVAAAVLGAVVGVLILVGMVATAVINAGAVK
jgi:hypothetical protein